MRGDSGSTTRGKRTAARTRHSGRAAGTARQANGACRTVGALAGGLLGATPVYRRTQSTALRAGTADNPTLRAPDASCARTDSTAGSSAPAECLRSVSTTAVAVCRAGRTAFGSLGR